MLVVKLKNTQLLHILALIVLALILTVPVINHGFFDAQDLPYHLKWSKHFSDQFWEGDLYPRWVKQELFRSDTVVQWVKKFTKASVTVGQGSLLIQRWKPREIILQTTATSEIWVTINQFYYPGWTARLKGESRVLPVQPLEPEGLLLLNVPRGKHKVIVTLDAGVEERAGQTISAIAAIITVFPIFWFRKVDGNGVAMT